MIMDSEKILVAIKPYSRAYPIPLDLSSVWDTKEEADQYAQQANAYAGQIISVKVNGSYKGYILQGENGNCTLEELGGGAGTRKQYVQVGTRPESGQEQGVIYIEDDKGYIWNGTDWKPIFEDASSSIADFNTRIGALETDIGSKANILNPDFSGSIKLEGKELATKEYAESLIEAAQSEAPIIIDAEHPFPETAYKAGQKYVVALEGEYLGQKCEAGDLILIIRDYVAETASNSDGLILQRNIDGAVTGAESSVDGDIVVFSGTTGKVIKSSKINMTSLTDAIEKAHEHANKEQLDTYDKTQEELLAEAANVAQKKVDALKTEVGANIDEKLNSKIGDLGSSTTVVEFVEKAVGSGGVDVSEQIEQALQKAKAYTDTALTIIEF